MIPAVRGEKLARFVDVFCEKGFFHGGADGPRSMAAARQGALTQGPCRAAVAVRQRGRAVKRGAASVDHLDCIEQADVDRALTGRDRGLPRARLELFPWQALSTRAAPARRRRGRGLGHRFQPGHLPLLGHAHDRLDRLHADEADAGRGAGQRPPINGAWALGLGQTHGALEPGKQADVVCYEAEDYREIPYYFGGAPTAVAWVMKKGAVVFLP